MHAVAPTLAYGPSIELLREIEYNQRMWHWANTEEAKNKETAPDRITLPGEDDVRQAMVEREQQHAIDVAAQLGINI